MAFSGSRMGSTVIGELLVVKKGEPTFIGHDREQRIGWS